MSSAFSYESSVIAAGETHVSVLERAYKPGVSPRRRLCFILHGAAQNSVQAGNTVDEARQIAEGLVEAGFVVLSIDATGTQNWGNDASAARMDTAFTWAIANLGAKTDKACAVSFSMGNITFLNWARTRLSQVSAFAGCISGINLQQLHDDNVLGSGALIEAAYGTNAAGMAAVYPTHSPHVYEASMSGLEAHFWYAINDQAAVPAWIIEFAAAIGKGATSFDPGAVLLGHSITNIPVANLVGYLSNYA